MILFQMLNHMLFFPHCFWVFPKDFFSLNSELKHIYFMVFLKRNTYNNSRIYFYTHYWINFLELLNLAWINSGEIFNEVIERDWFIITRPFLYSTSPFRLSYFCVFLFLSFSVKTKNKLFAEVTVLLPCFICYLPVFMAIY